MRCTGWNYLANVKRGMLVNDDVSRNYGSDEIPVNGPL